MADPVTISMGVAQILVPAIINPVIEKLFEEWRERRQLERGVDKEIKRLLSTTKLFKGVLQDAHNKSGQSAVHTWLMELKEVLYDAEDVLDGYATDLAVLEAEHGLAWIKKLKAKVSRYFTPDYDNLALGMVGRLKAAKNIKEINERLDGLAKTSHRLGIQVLSEHDPSRFNNPINMQWRSNETSIEDTIVEGRDDVKQYVIDTFMKILYKEDNEVSSISMNKSLFILPIVGMGGLGKTTVARMVFNDEWVDDKFQIRVWVCVSDNFNVVHITKSIIDSIYRLRGSNDPCRWTNLEDLHRELVKLVAEKNFLLILDDVWADESYLWESLLKPLKVSKTGINCVMITTRETRVVNAIDGFMNPVNLTSLNEENIWKIIHKSAFPKNKIDTIGEGLSKELEAIGKGIIKRLKGNPLAAKSIGKLLGSNYTSQHWINIRESDMWKLQQKEDDTLPILMLSYQHLPANLKQCLIYLSLFPKDYEYQESEIIHLWMAHKCISQENDVRVEDVGRRYLETLVSRSFLQCVSENSRIILQSGKYLKFVSCHYIMHDLIHDMVQSISKSECFWINSTGDNETFVRNDDGNKNKFLHVSCTSSGKDLSVPHIYNGISKYEKIRSLMFHDGSVVIDDKLVAHLCENLKYLRVLKLKKCSMKDLCKSIGNLKHLRLLDLSESTVRNLPQSLGCLHNLQVLDLHECRDLEALPSSTTKLASLRHLVADPDKISSIHGIGRLSLLQNLELFSVQEKDGFRIGELRGLNMIRGRLKIRYLENVKSKGEALQACLAQKIHLQKLVLDWPSKEEDSSDECSTEEKEENSSDECSTAEEVLEALKPCQFLKKIYIFNYMGVRPPSWLNSTWMGLLEHIRIIGCKNLETLPLSLGKMRFLKHLRVDTSSMKEIIWQPTSGDHPSYLPNESRADLFPVLETLSFDDNLELVRWCIEEREDGRTIADASASNILPRLEKLTIFDSPQLEFVRASGMGALKHLVLWNVGSGISDILRHLCLHASLETLSLVSQSDVSPFPEGLLPSSLKELRIKKYSKMRSCCLCPTMTSLRKLSIENCPSLATCIFPPDLTAMEELTLKDCPLLESLPDTRALTSLRSIYILGSCPKLEGKYKGKGRQEETGNNTIIRWRHGIF